MTRSMAVHCANRATTTGPAERRNDTGVTHNGDIHNTGVHIDNVNAESGTDNDAAARNLEQQMNSVGGK
jgi:hypothetical protein